MQMNFTPPTFKPLQLLGYVPGAVNVIAQSMRMRQARRLPIAYGWITKRADDALTAPLLSAYGYGRR